MTETTPLPPGLFGTLVGFQRLQSTAILSFVVSRCEVQVRGSFTMWTSKGHRLKERDQLVEWMEPCRFSSPSTPDVTPPTILCQIFSTSRNRPQGDPVYYPSTDGKWVGPEVETDVSLLPFTRWDQSVDDVQFRVRGERGVRMKFICTLNQEDV